MSRHYFFSLFSSSSSFLYMYVCVCVGIHIGACGNRKLTGTFLHRSAPYFLKEGLSLARAHRFNQLAPNMPCLCLRGAEIAGSHHGCPALVPVRGVQTPVLMLLRQTQLPMQTAPPSCHCKVKLGGAVHLSQQEHGNGTLQVQGAESRQHNKQTGNRENGSYKTSRKKLKHFCVTFSLARPILDFLSTDLQG